MPRKDLDLGDFLGVEGAVKRTRTGRTLFAGYELLTRALRPGAEVARAGGQTRYRQRYLTWSRTRGAGRSASGSVVGEMRAWLTARGYPVGRPCSTDSGGATARPFITHHNTYDRDFYLRIAPSCTWKVIVGGSKRC